MQDQMQDVRWKGLFEDLPREHGFEPLRIEGALPEDLSGTLWLNGPARWRWPGHKSTMWFDGDGAVTAVRLGGGEAKGASRFVRTRSVEKEREAGEILYGRYARRSPRLLREMWLGDRRNPGNTSVWPVGGRIFALCPEGVPVEIDEDTAETLGEEDFGGLLTPGFSAHASHGWSRHADYNFTLRAGLRSYLDLYEFPEGGEARLLTSVPVARPCFLHDFMVTDRWAVFLLPPLCFKPLPLLLGLKPLGECLRWEPEHGAEVLLVGLDAPHEVVRFEVPAMAILHWANAWEEGGKVVAQAPVVRDMPRTWRWLESLAAAEARPIPDPILSRLEIDPIKKTLSIEALTDRVGEQPRIDPYREQRPSRLIHHAAFSGESGIYDRIVQLDAVTGRSVEVGFGEGVYPAEAVYVPRGPGVGEGWLLSLVFDPAANRSGLAVADALRPDAGPVATAWMDHHVPMPIHGSWVGKGDRASG